MRAAMDLGEHALGSTSPNPPVGAVVLDRRQQVVGRGSTRPPGQAHAEVVALAEAGGRARGGTAVVTLEPCNHTGRTGPCVDALLAAGVARVVYAVGDPDPVAAGGASRLRAAGVDVVGGVSSAAAAAGALCWWLFATRTGRPFVIWKFAATLDGRVAAADGTSRWITGEPARADTHRLRAQIDAIMVGSGTVRADDPQLTSRGPGGELATRQPLRVVVDRRGRVPDTARVRDASARTVVLDHAGPDGVLTDLWGRGIRSVLLEGGPTLAGAFVAAGRVDQVVAYLAPALLGAGPGVLGPAGVTTIAEAVRLEIETVDRLGADLKITARLRAAGAPRDPRPGNGAAG